MKTKVFLFGIILVVLLTGCRKTQSFESSSKINGRKTSSHDFFSNYDSLSEKDALKLCDKYGKNKVLFESEMKCYSDCQMYIECYVNSLESLDYVKVVKFSVDLPEADYHAEKEINKELEKLSKPFESVYAESYVAYDSAGISIEGKSVRHDDVIERLKKTGKYNVHLTVQYEVKKQDEVFLFDDEEICILTIKNKLTEKDYLIIAYVYAFFGIVVLILILINRKPPRKVLAFLIWGFYGMWGFHNFYFREYRNSIGKIIASLINLPFFLYFFFNFINIVENPMSDPSYGACFLALIGGIIPCCILFFMCISDFVRIVHKFDYESSKANIK